MKEHCEDKSRDNRFLLNKRVLMESQKPATTSMTMNLQFKQKINSNKLSKVNRLTLKDKLIFNSSISNDNSTNNSLTLNSRKASKNNKVVKNSVSPKGTTYPKNFQLLKGKESKGTTFSKINVHKCSRRSKNSKISTNLKDNLISRTKTSEDKLSYFRVLENKVEYKGRISKIKLFENKIEDKDTFSKDRTFSKIKVFENMIEDKDKFSKDRTFSKSNNSVHWNNKTPSTNVYSSNNTSSKTTKAFKNTAARTSIASSRHPNKESRIKSSSRVKP